MRVFKAYTLYNILFFDIYTNSLLVGNYFFCMLEAAPSVASGEDFGVMMVPV